MKRLLLALAATMTMTTQAIAQTTSGYDIGTSGGTGFIAQMEALLQSWINFASGPFGVAVCVFGFILAVLAWVFAPKSGALGLAVRAIAATLVIFNIGSLIAAFVLP